MNYNNNMYFNKTNDNIDPNYIYPQPYIDPLMYMNPYNMNNGQMGNLNQGTGSEYPTYFNQYVDNPLFNPYENMNNGNINGGFENNPNMNNNNMNNYNGNNYNGNNNNANNDVDYMNNIPMIPMMPMMPPNMMYPGMFPPNMMFPGMPPGMPPNMTYQGMMYPGTFPPNMMYPGVMQNIPTVNMDEFDEEEM